MLNSLRSFASSPIGILVFGAIIVGLLAFGLTSTGGQTVVARVASEQISAVEFQTEYEAELQRIFQQEGISLSPSQSMQRDVPRQVLDRMAANAALVDHMATLGLGISDEEVAAMIALQPQFRTSDDAFNRTLFDNFLRSQGITEGELIDAQSEVLVRRQIFRTLAPSTAGLPPAYEAVMTAFYTQERSIDYLTLTPDALGETPAEPTEEELLAYFQDNATDWSAPELRAADLLVLTPAQLAVPEDVTDDEVQAAYDAQAEGLGTPETRTVSIFVFNSRADADVVAAELEAGTTFDALVEAATITPTNLGTVTRNGISNATLREAAFSTPEGETQIVDGPAGATLVHVSEVIEGEIPPLEDVADGIRQGLAEQAAVARINALYLDIEDLRAAGLTLPEVGTELGLEVEGIVVDAEGRDANGDPIVDLPGGNELATEIFQSDVGLADAALQLPGAASYAWYEVTEVIAPRDRELDEVRDQVVAAWQEESISLRLEALAESIAALLRADEPIEDIEAEFGVTFQSASGLSRLSEAPEGAPSNLPSLAFIGAEGYVDTTPNPDGSGYIVVRVSEVTVPETEAGEDMQQRLVAIQDQLANSVVNSYVLDVFNRLGQYGINDELLLQVVGVVQ